MQKLILSFDKLSDADFGFNAQDILTAMTGNPNFTTPYPALTLVETNVNDYLAALLAAGTRDRAKIAFKNSARQTLTETLIALGNYVQSICNGDEAKLVSSGFTLTKQREPQPPLTALQNFTVGNGLNKGEIITSVDRLAGARSYLHQYTTDPLSPESAWTSIASASRKHLFTDLESGKNLWFRIAAIGTKGQIVYTAPQARIVL
jgi:hypothetical protein